MKQKMVVESFKAPTELVDEKGPLAPYEEISESSLTILTSSLPPWTIEVLSSWGFPILKWKKILRILLPNLMKPMIRISRMF